MIYYLLLNQHSYCPWSYQTTPQLARLAIGVLQVSHFFLYSIFSIDLFQNMSVFFLHRVLMIDKLVGPKREAVIPTVDIAVTKEEEIDGAIVSPTRRSKKSRKNEAKKNS